VFDLHFHAEDPQLFAIASSVGSVALFKVDSPCSSSTPQINHIWTLPVHEDPSIPALFLAWTPKPWLPDSLDGFAVTFSDGRTSIFGTTTGKKIADQTSISDLGHFDARQTIEVWFVALAAYQDNPADGDQSRVPFLFTGNDFGSLHTRRFNSDKASDEEVEDDEQSILPSLLLDHDDRARHHSAGVTSILPLPVPLIKDAPLLLTGNYDEYLRVYHATLKGNTLAEICLGGGVWRLQVLRTEKPAASDVEGSEWRFLVLASCMHAGTRVVRITWRPHDGKDDDWEMDIVAEFTEHESMNYASDTWKGNNRGGELVCVSSSFYDRRVCLWRAEV
jgi:diphthamide biosynthesis protein 7